MAGAAAEAAGVAGRRLGELRRRATRPRRRFPTAEPDDIAYLQYSSGSTRFPHGVAVTHRGLLDNLAAHSHGMELGDDDRCVSWLPWYHDMGLVGCLLSPIANQVSADYLKTEDFARRPLAWLDLISRNQGTTLSYSPTFGYDICARRDLQPDQCRRALRPVALADRRQRRRHDPPRRDAGLRRRLRTRPASTPRAFLPSYGLAEATLAVSIMPPGEGIVVELVEETTLSGDGKVQRDRPQRYRAIVNCGKPVRDMEIEIRDEDGAPLAERADRQGLRAAAPSVMPGYFRDEEATEACLGATAGSTPATWAICRTAISTSSAAPRT